MAILHSVMPSRFPEIDLSSGACSFHYTETTGQTRTIHIGTDFFQYARQIRETSSKLSTPMWEIISSCGKELISIPESLKSSTFVLSNIFLQFSPESTDFQREFTSTHQAKVITQASITAIEPEESLWDCALDKLFGLQQRQSVFHLVTGNRITSAVSREVTGISLPKRELHPAFSLRTLSSIGDPLPIPKIFERFRSLEEAESSCRLNEAFSDPIPRSTYRKIFKEVCLAVGRLNHFDSSYYKKVSDALLKDDFLASGNLYWWPEAYSNLANDYCLRSTSSIHIWTQGISMELRRFSGGDDLSLTFPEWDPCLNPLLEKPWKIKSFYYTPKRTFPLPEKLADFGPEDPIVRNFQYNAFPARDTSGENLPQLKNHLGYWQNVTSNLELSALGLISGLATCGYLFVILATYSTSPLLLGICIPGALISLSFFLLYSYCNLIAGLGESLWGQLRKWYYDLTFDMSSLDAL